ncbi:MAG TPA: AAA family ATPase [Acidimicrobiales bacterium]|nr:AAA family ATPase [Acidimicrobiales bacterium]
MTTPFCDLEAEESVVGACLFSRPAVETTTRALVASDFGSAHPSAAFGAIVSLHKAGAAVDPLTVADELTASGTAWTDARGDLSRWAAEVPSAASIGRYCEIVARFASRRALHGVGTEITAAASDPERDPGDVVDEARALLAFVDAPRLTIAGDIQLDDFVAERDDASPEVVPGLLAEDDRVVIVAPEGVGKSELARQVVVCAAYGVQPFTFDPAPAVPALLVDLENPRRNVRDRLRKLASTARAHSGSERAPAVLWHRPGGIDLRRRPDRLAFEDVLRRNRPKLVSLGPVYKAYTRTGRESDEQVAAEVQAILDDLRTRYGFALVLEHHAPQANGGARELRPFGSSLWLRWPEYGLKLTPSRDVHGALVVGRWRGDRAVAQWPDELRRGDVWPWAGWWRHGMPEGSEDGGRW